MRGSIILILIVCAGGSFFAYSYFSQEAAVSKNNEQTFQEKLAKSGGLVEKQTIAFSQQAEKTVEDFQKQATEITIAAKETKDKLAVKIDELLNNAKGYLDAGNYKQAIESAQNALKLNPNLQEAKDILETANQKLAALTSEKVNEFKTGISDKVGETKAALGNIGQ